MHIVVFIILNLNIPALMLFTALSWHDWEREDKRERNVCKMLELVLWLCMASFVKIAIRNKSRICK